MSMPKKSMPKNIRTNLIKVEFFAKMKFSFMATMPKGKKKRAAARRRAALTGALKKVAVVVIGLIFLTINVLSSPTSEFATPGSTAMLPAPSMPNLVRYKGCAIQEVCGSHTFVLAAVSEPDNRNQRVLKRSYIH